MSCQTPFVLTDKKTYMNHAKTISVPCGKCPACLKRRVSGWSFRLMQEEKVSHSAHFITLTYDTDRVPITRKGFMGLRKRDLQLFFKRIRKRQAVRAVRDSQLYDTLVRDAVRAGCKSVKSGRLGSCGGFSLPVRYFAVGEYGGKTMRPHYHVVMFNVDVELVERCWGLGQIHIGKVSEASVGYTLKYMMKNGKIPLHSNDDRLPEFQLMSKGLGKNYLTKAMVSWHKADLLQRMYCNLKEGKKIAMPRYYKDKLYSLEERSCISGFHKGQLEKEHNEYEHGITSQVRHQRVESDKAGFRKMFSKAIEGHKI